MQQQISVITLGIADLVRLAHNVATQEAVQPTLDRLAQFGGTLLRPADAPPHGGLRGYIANPDGTTARNLA